MVFLEVDNAVIERRALEPCIYIAASMMDLAVDVLGLILDLFVCLIDFAIGIIKDVLSLVKNRLAVLLNFDVLENLGISDDKGRCQRQQWYNA